MKHLFAAIVATVAFAAAAEDAATIITANAALKDGSTVKGELATKTTIAIIETYAKVRGLKRELVELHNEKDRKKQTEKINHFGETLVDIVMPDLDTVETESSLEINFFIGKIRHVLLRIGRFYCFYNTKFF